MLYNGVVNQSEVPDRVIELGPFVRDRRLNSRLTQAELGDLAGVGKRFIVELEQGKPTLRLDKVNQVLAVFGKQLGLVDATREPAEEPRTNR
jgi:y4mF family transcriptional regulator